MRIFIFGDSIAQGFYDSEGGWAGRLASEYHLATLASITEGNKEWYDVFNLGVSGDTAAGVAERLEAEVTARQLYDSDGPDVIVLAVGINDARLTNNRAAMDVYEFQEAYEAAIDTAKQLQTRVVCVGLTAVDEAKTDPWVGSSSGKQWKNNRINLFEDAIKQSAVRKEVAFVPIHDDFLKQLEAGKPLLADGLHPNNAGHVWLRKRIEAVL